MRRWLRDMHLRWTECRRQGHAWVRSFYGDAILWMGGTHECARCGVHVCPAVIFGDGSTQCWHDDVVGWSPHW